MDKLDDRDPQFQDSRMVAIQVALAVVILMAVSTSSSVTASATNATAPSSINSTIAKPGCADRCGNVSIPFPFGTAPGCYRNDDFFINCSESIPFLGKTNIDIKNISLIHGYLTVMPYIASQCYDENRTQVYYDTSWIELSGMTEFTVSNAANKFVAVGCDTRGIVSGRRLDGRSFKTGCTTTCGGKDDVENGTCTGLGCCQTSIPKNISGFDVSLKSDNKYKNVKNLSRCGYAFVVEENAFSFYPQNITSLRNVSNLPMVLDWTIPIETCREGKANSSAYACRSVNSECYEAQNGFGYRCNCSQGYEGNPYLDAGCRDVDECENSDLNDCEKGCINTQGSFECHCPKGYYGDGKKSRKGCIRGGLLIFRLVSEISIGIIILLVSACWIYILLQRRRLYKMRQRYFRQNGGILLQEKLRGKEGLSSSSNTTIIFSEAELKKATINFNNTKIIGQGGFGTVYKGSLPADNRVVAIKKSKEVPKQADQFANEIIVLSQINHRNVVKLLGCCLETKFPLLVYEFVSNGTLYEHIHNKPKARSLSWDTRLKIAAETAGVLSYLHFEASTPIIHRDVKSSNILLDHDLTAKVSDFGASRLFPLDHTEITTLVQGTFGYLDPEYMQTSQLTEKSDVYSFGVVLVELLTGRKAVCSDRPEEERSLANFFLTVVEKEELLFQILDENVVREGDKDVVMKVAELAKRCLNVRGEERPCMKEVEMELEALRFGGEKRRHHKVNAEDEKSDELGDYGFNSFTSFEGTSNTSLGFDSTNG